VPELLDPWEVIDEGGSLSEELRREVCPGHLLCNAQVRAIARRVDCDDVLFEVAGLAFSLAVVHLTWKQEQDAQWPWAEPYADWDDFMARRHDPDVDEWKTLLKTNQQ
jgi:hypothetical protein